VSGPSYADNKFKTVDCGHLKIYKLLFFSNRLVQEIATKFGRVNLQQTLKPDGTFIWFLKIQDGGWPEFKNKFKKEIAIFRSGSSYRSETAHELVSQ